MRGSLVVVTDQLPRSLGSVRATSTRLTAETSSFYNSTGFEASSAASRPAASCRAEQIVQLIFQLVLFALTERRIIDDAMLSVGIATRLRP